MQAWQSNLQSQIVQPYRSSIKRNTVRVDHGHSKEECVVFATVVVVGGGVDNIVMHFEVGLW